MIGVDKTQAAYWLGNLTRGDAQKVFDEYAAVLAQFAERLQKIDACIGFLFDKLGAKPEDVGPWLEKRVAELVAQQEAAKNPVIQ
jgi:hypothetical protein